MRSSHGILLLPTANCTLYRHTWYVFRRLISFGCLPNLLVSQERGTWDSTKCCYLSVTNNLSIYFNSMDNSASSPFVCCMSQLAILRQRLTKSLDAECSVLYVGVLISLWLFLFAAQPIEFFLDGLKKFEQ
jgi:hypothetical protein